MKKLVFGMEMQTSLPDHDVRYVGYQHGKHICWSITNEEIVTLKELGPWMLQRERTYKTFEEWYQYIIDYKPTEKMVEIDGVPFTTNSPKWEDR